MDVHRTLFIPDLIVATVGACFHYLFSFLEIFLSFYPYGFLTLKMIIKFEVTVCSLFGRLRDCVICRFHRQGYPCGFILHTILLTSFFSLCIWTNISKAIIHLIWYQSLFLKCQAGLQEANIDHQLHTCISSSFLFF